MTKDERKIVLVTNLETGKQAHVYVLPHRVPEMQKELEGMCTVVEQTPLDVIMGGEIKIGE